MLLAGLVCLGVSGCAAVPETPFPKPSEEPIPFPPEQQPAETGEPAKAPERPSPRAVASLRLTEHARMLLKSGHPDEAIRTLERAINLNPGNGENYYYLSEAWYQKENFLQAQEFNRLARLYLQDDPEWTGRVIEQQERIKRRRR